MRPLLDGAGTRRSSRKPEGAAGTRARPGAHSVHDGAASIRTARPQHDTAMNVGSTITSRDTTRCATWCRPPGPLGAAEVEEGAARATTRMAAAAASIAALKPGPTARPPRRRWRAHDRPCAPRRGREEDDGKPIHFSRRPGGGAAGAPARRTSVIRRAIPVRRLRPRSGISDSRRARGWRSRPSRIRRRRTGAPRWDRPSPGGLVFLQQLLVVDAIDAEAHLVITWRASSISRAPYGQAQAQYLQPMHLS